MIISHQNAWMRYLLTSIDSKAVNKYSRNKIPVNKKAMADPTRGGRSKTAPYETSHLRVPTPIMEKLWVLVRVYKEAVAADQETEYLDRLDDAVSYVVYPEDSQLREKPVVQQKGLTKEEAIEEAKGIIKHTTKGKKEKMENLLTRIYEGSDNQQ